MPQERSTSTGSADVRNRTRRRVILLVGLIVVVVATGITVGTVFVVQAFKRAMTPDYGRVNEVMAAVNAGDVGAFLRCFDRPPADAAPAAFIQTMTARYGTFQSAVQTTRWGEPVRNHVSSAKFTLTFTNGQVGAEVTMRLLVDEASATGNLNFLGQSRMVRLAINDATLGDLVFP
jgi:hypothetical protein